MARACSIRVRVEGGSCSPTARRTLQTKLDKVAAVEQRKQSKVRAKAEAARQKLLRKKKKTENDLKKLESLLPEHRYAAPKKKKRVKKKAAKRVAKRAPKRSKKKAAKRAPKRAKKKATKRRTKAKPRKAQRPAGFGTSQQGPSPFDRKPKRKKAAKKRSKKQTRAAFSNFTRAEKARAKKRIKRGKAAMEAVDFAAFH